MRQENIDYLIRHNIPVTEDAIKHVSLNSGNTDLFISNVNNGYLALDTKGINEAYNYIAGLYANCISKKIPLRNNLDSLGASIDERINDLKSSVDILREEVAAASVLESSMSGQTQTTLIDFSDPAIISNESSGVKISNGSLVVDTNGEKSVKSAVRIEEYPFSSMTAVMRSRTSIEKAKIEGIASSGIGYLPSLEDMVINADKAFRIEAIADLDLERRIDLLIDRKDSSMFNQIELSLESAQMVTVHSSVDGEEFTAHVNNPKYVKESSIQIKPTTDRYIKIIFHKRARDGIRNGNNIYSVAVNSISFLRTTFSGSSTLITNPISIDGVHSKIAISTCDSTSEGLDTEIKYYLSINEQEYRSIRPADRRSGEDMTKPSFISINSMVENKSMLLTDKEDVDGGSSFLTPLPADFIRSNYIRIFSDNLTDSASEWNYDRGIYSSVAVLYEATTIDFGPEEISLNGRWVSGVVDLYPDVYIIQVKAGNYANVILNKLGNVKDLGSGEFAVEGTDGLVRTVFDPIYPYNHRYLVDFYFDLVFGKELIDKDDYNIYNKDSDYFVSTSNIHDEIIISYRLHESSVGSVKLKAELQSRNPIDIPFIHKIIVRLA